MTFGLGLALLVIGIALIFIARARADGTSILPIGEGLLIVYPVICLGFIAFGIALMITGS